MNSPKCFGRVTQECNSKIPMSHEPCCPTKLRAKRNNSRKIFVCNAGVIFCVLLCAFGGKSFSKQKKVCACNNCVTDSTLFKHVECDCDVVLLALKSPLQATEPDGPGPKSPKVSTKEPGPGRPGNPSDLLGLSGPSQEKRVF